MKKILIKIFLYRIGILALILIFVGCEKTEKIAEYKGYFTVSTDDVISVPEIKGNKFNVELYCYYSTDRITWEEIPEAWTIPYKRMYSPGWKSGEVYLYKMQAGDNYLIQIYK